MPRVVPHQLLPHGFERLETGHHLWRQTCGCVGFGLMDTVAIRHSNKQSQTSLRDKRDYGAVSMSHSRATCLVCPVLSVHTNSTFQAVALLHRPVPRQCHSSARNATIIISYHTRLLSCQQSRSRCDLTSPGNAGRIAELSEGADRGYRPVDSGRVSPVDQFVYDVVTCTLGLVTLACIE
jgi:hypothetical protein